MAHYCDPKHLKELIIDAKKTGVVGEELAQLVSLIGKGVHQRFGDMCSVEEEDFRQAVVLKILSRIHQVDARRSPATIFNYLTSVAMNELRYFRRYEQSQRRIVAGFRQHLLEVFPIQRGKGGKKH